MDTTLVPSKVLAPKASGCVLGGTEEISGAVCIKTIVNIWRRTTRRSKSGAVGAAEVVFPGMPASTMLGMPKFGWLNTLKNRMWTGPGAVRK
jgi:hypothetical protein